MVCDGRTIEGSSVHGTGRPELSTWRCQIVTISKSSDLSHH
jgi:hypothetical protein